MPFASIQPCRCRSRSDSTAPCGSRLRHRCSSHSRRSHRYRSQTRYRAAAYMRVPSTTGALRFAACADAIMAMALTAPKITFRFIARIPPRYCNRPGARFRTTRGGQIRGAATRARKVETGMFPWVMQNSNGVMWHGAIAQRVGDPGFGTSLPFWNRYGSFAASRLQQRRCAIRQVPMSSAPNKNGAPEGAVSEAR